MRFNAQPTLTGTLVKLRPLRADDYDALYAVASDPLIWEQHPDQTRYTPDGFRTFFDQSLASGGALVAMDQSNDQIIGSSRYHGYDGAKSQVEIGWSVLARSYWGGRYNGEMKSLMLRHAFQFVERVIFLVGIENLRSQKAVEKIGGVRVGTRADANGNDSYIFAITRHEFDERDAPNS